MSKYKIKAVVKEIEFKDTKVHIYLKGTAEYQWCASARKERVFNVLEILDKENPNNEIVDKLIVQLEETTNLPNSYLISVLTHSFCENTPFLFELEGPKKVTLNDNGENKKEVNVYSIVSITKPGVD